MAEREKEWDSWHTATLQTENGPKTHYFTIEVVIREGQSIKIRQDFKSPYYKFRSFTNDMMKRVGEQQREYLHVLNALENTAYHDELQFLQTQLHLMELYWNMKSDKDKGPQPTAADYAKTHKLLKKEIKLFKKDKTRVAFTRSSMKWDDFSLIQSMRNEYTKDAHAIKRHELALQKEAVRKLLSDYPYYDKSQSGITKALSIQKVPFPLNTSLI